MQVKGLLGWLRAAGEKWQSDDCLTMGASLAYYALFSLFPLILIILSIVGALIDAGDSEVRGRILLLTGSNEARDLISSTLQDMNNNSASAGLVGFVTLLIGASGVFGALDRSFDVIWDVHTLPKRNTGLIATVVEFLQDKLLAFALVLGCVVLMILSVASTVVLTALNTYTATLPGQAFVMQALQFALSQALLTITFMALFKYLPDRPVAWGDVWAGALAAALLFTVLQKLFGLYVGRSNYASYGAVGGVMALLVWIYVSSQVLLFGGQLSYAWARAFGSLARGRERRLGDKGVKGQQ